MLTGCRALRRRNSVCVSMVVGYGHSIEFAQEAEGIAGVSGCCADDVVTMEQVHGKEAHRVDMAPAIKLKGDALFTRTKGPVLVVRTADCLPVFFSQKGQHPVAGIIHAGWRGLQQGIIKSTLEQALDSANGTDLEVWFGPAIGGDSYEVGLDVARHFAATVPSPAPGKYWLDISEAAKQQLPAHATLLTDWNECTFKGRDFYSHRRGDSGRNYNLIWME